MRILLDCRWVVVGKSMLARGTGRYIMQQIEAVLTHDPTNEYIVLLPTLKAIDHFPYTGIRDKKNVRFVKVRDFQDYSADKILLYQELFQEEIEPLRPDVYHHLAPMALPMICHWSFDVCPMVVNLFDVIPSQLPDKYQVDDDYYRTLAFCQSAQHILTLSEYSKVQIARTLDYPVNQISIAPPYANPVFQPVTDNGIRAKYHLPDQYFLTVGGMHYAKGGEVLVQAYAQLPETIRQSVPLVFAFDIPAMEQEDIARAGALYDCDFRTLGFVPDADLAALYSQCLAYIHPSRLEGFGLPPLEAMQCGALVISSDSSSLPEVVGSAGVYFKDGHSDDLARMLQVIYAQSTPVWFDLAIRQAATFTPQRLAQATLEAYQLAKRWNDLTYRNLINAFTGDFNIQVRRDGLHQSFQWEVDL